MQQIEREGALVAPSIEAEAGFELPLRHILLGFPDAASGPLLSLDALIALPQERALNAQLRVSVDGSVSAAIHLDSDATFDPGLLDQMVPLLFGQVRLARKPRSAPAPDFVTLLPQWHTTPESKTRPSLHRSPREEPARSSARPPRPVADWPWDLTRALAVLAASGGGSLAIFVRHRARDAAIVREIASETAAAQRQCYIHPEDPQPRRLLAALGAMQSDPALFALEVGISASASASTRTLVSLALFGTPCGEDAAPESPDLRCLAGNSHAPRRILPFAQEVAGLLANPPLVAPHEPASCVIGYVAGGVPVGLNPRDRARHLYVIGGTGTGKSTLLCSLIAQDIAAGEGVILIDPHGDLAREVEGLVPRKRARDLILADAADPAGCFALDLLPNASDEAGFEIASDMLVSLFKEAIYDGVKEAFGPVFEQYFRNALGLLLAASGEERTLANLPRIFSDRKFRGELLEASIDVTVVDFWKGTAARTDGEMSLTNITPYITSKLTRLVGSPAARRMFPAAGHCIDFGDAMDAGKIMLLRCPAGVLGEGLAALAMTASLMQIRAAAMARVNTDTGLRRSIRVYIDEFQACRGGVLQSLLAEGRKFGLCLTLANQSLGQIGGSSRASIGAAALANVGNIVTFRLGPVDAIQLSPWLQKPETWRDLCRMPDFAMQARLLQQGRPVHFPHIGQCQSP